MEKKEERKILFCGQAERNKPRKNIGDESEDDSDCGGFRSKGKKSKFSKKDSICQSKRKVKR